MDLCHGSDSVTGLLQQFAISRMQNTIRLQIQEAVDDLKVVFYPVMDFLEQSLLLRERRSQSFVHLLQLLTAPMDLGLHAHLPLAARPPQADVVGNILDPMNDVFHVSHLVDYGRIDGTPIALLENPTLRGRPTDVVF